MTNQEIRTDPCKILFLFGAGASIPAGVKSTIQLTELLLSAFQQDSFLKKQSWLPSLWHLIEQHAVLSSHAMGPYEPNFEHLVYAIELLEDYTDVYRMLNNEYVKSIKELAKKAEIKNDFDAYAATSYALLPITLDAKSTNPNSLQFQIKGSSAKYMWTAKAIRRILADQFPVRYDLNYLEPIAELFRESPEQVTIATTNYDLVLELFLTNHRIPFYDGFAANSQFARWKGFPLHNSGVTYLKLHGSLDWFQLKKEWFNVTPLDLSPNDVYKVSDQTVMKVIKKELAEKKSKDPKYKFEFDVPHLILGGNKDRKILNVPYVDIHRVWASRLAIAETIVFIGIGASDFHLLQQVRGLIATNSFLSKIFIINPSWESHLRLATFLNLSRIRPDVRLFHIECGWDPALIEAEYKLPFAKMIKMTSKDLCMHFKECLSA